MGGIISAVRLSIRVQLVGALVAGLAVLGAAVAVLLQFVHERTVVTAAQHEVALTALTLGQVERLEIARMSGILDVLVTNHRIAERLAAGDREGLLALTGPMFASLRARHGVTHWYFHHPDPRADGVLLRLHRPELHGDPVRRPVVARAVQTGETASGRELGRTAFAVRVARPWVHEGKVIGYVELAEDVPVFLERVRAMTGDHLGMLLAKERLDEHTWSAVMAEGHRWADRPELVAVETTTGDDALLGGLGRLEDLPEDPAVIEIIEAGPQRLARGVFALRGPEGEKIGAVVVLHDVTALYRGVSELRGRVVVLVGVLAVGLGAILVFLLETLVFERLARMSRRLEELPDRLARGEYGLEDADRPRDDELGRFERFFGQALRRVGSFVADVRRERQAPRPPSHGAPLE